MNCRRVQQLLSDYHDGLLTDRQAGDVAAHLCGCPGCRRLRDALVVFEAKVRETAQWQPTPRRDFRRHALDGWIAERKTAAPSSHRWFLIKPHASATWPALAGTAAIVVLVAVLGFMLARGHQGRMNGLRGPSVALRPHSQPAASAPDRAPEARVDSIEGKIVKASPTAPRRESRRIRSSTALSVSVMRQGAGGSPSSIHARRIAVHRADDLTYMNEDPAAIHPRWSLSRDEWEAIEARLRRIVQVRDDFVQIPFPRLASTSSAQVAAAVAAYRREAAIVDSRLSREVGLQFKATALSDLCDRLRADTGIHLEASRSVADEKVTLFCEKMPLRDVMRQLSRPFGYTWLRGGKQDEYRYELVQDLRSQLLEEELRNRDRNQALLALERELARFRPYLDLSPEDARSRLQKLTVSGRDPLGEKKLLEKLAGDSWGPLHIYFRLTPQDLAALRAGQALWFSQEPAAGEQALPPELARGILQTVQRRVLIRDGGYTVTRSNDPNGVPLTAIPEARALVTLRLYQSELGQWAFEGSSGYRIAFNPLNGKDLSSRTGSGPAAIGVSPTAFTPANRLANARLAADPSLRPRVTVEVKGRGSRVEGQGSRVKGRGPGSGATHDARRPTYDPRPLTLDPRPLTLDPRVTTADVLEALHRATGLPIVADYYTRLYPASAVSVRNLPLFDALNHLADTMRLRWRKESEWLQFRSTSFYDDRLKEVPNRLLARWSASHRQHSALTLDDLLEIVQLSDAQLNAAEMAEGARECWGLADWDLARGREQRPDLRFLATLMPAQREAAMSAAGLTFRQMSLAQQQQFMAVAHRFLVAKHGTEEARTALEALAGARLRVVHTPPGCFEWKAPEGPVYTPPPGNRHGELALVRARTREAALQAARRIDPQVDTADIVPSESSVTVHYLWGGLLAEVGGLALRATAHGASRRTLRITTP